MTVVNLSNFKLSHCWHETLTSAEYVEPSDETYSTINSKGSSVLPRGIVSIGRP